MLHPGRFRFYDILEKEKIWRQKKKISRHQGLGEGQMSRQGTGDFLGQ